MGTWQESIMRKRTVVFGCLVLWSGLAVADMTRSEGTGEAIPGQEELMVDLTCVLSAEGPSVERGELVVRLYEYDPRVADRSAAEIGRIAVAGFAHRAGEETVLRFPCTGTTDRRRAYYITAVVYPEGAAPDRSGIYYLDGFQRVLADGVREALSVVLTPVAEIQGPGH